MKVSLAGMRFRALRKPFLTLVVAIASAQSFLAASDTESWSALLALALMAIAAGLAILDFRDAMNDIDETTDKLLGRKCAHPCSTCQRPLAHQSRMGQ